MRRAFNSIITSFFLTAGFFASGAFPGENFTISLKGGPRQTEAAIHLRGDKLNLDGALTILHEEGIITAKITPAEDMPVFRLPQMEAGGSLSAELERSKKDGFRGLSGRVSGENLFFRVPGEGVFIGNGNLSGEIRENIIRIESLQFNNDGNALVTGEINFTDEKPSAKIFFESERFPVLARADRLLKISGTGAVELLEGQTYVEGDFRVDRADIFVREVSAAPPPADDIVVIGDEELPEARPYPFKRASIKLNLGDQFRIRTGELDTKLEGKLNLEISDADLSVTGSVRTVDGKYRAYGQEMYIRRGVITFTGPPENPGLDVLALHKHRRIDVGVRISGTLAAPQIELYSYPDMPDAEKLSFLVLGRGFETAGGGELSLIAAAAAAILAPEEYAALESEILRTTGLDEIRLAPGEDREETVVVLGKRISSRLYFTYKRGLAGLTNASILEYFLSPRWIVRAEAGYDNLIGLTYSIKFD